MSIDLLKKKRDNKGDGTFETLRAIVALLFSITHLHGKSNRFPRETSSLIYKPHTSPQYLYKCKWEIASILHFNS